MKYYMLMVSVLVVLSSFALGVNLEELALVGQCWQSEDCAEGSNCSTVDWYVDGKIDILDLQQLAASWLDASVVTYVPVLMDGFESGAFDGFAWQDSGDADWVITSDDYNDGSYSAKSGAITHDQESTLEFTIDTDDKDTISFYSVVSSEYGYDFLDFYIDGVWQDGWSGETYWDIQAYTITPGVHTFKWTYIKDESDGYESWDCGWIDDIQIWKAEPITVPDFVGMTSAEVETEASESGVKVLKFFYDFSDDVAEGDVISQDVSSGTSIMSSDAVLITVSLGAAAAGLDDGFESGDFGSSSWGLSGDSDWVVVSNVKNGGNYSAKSGVVGDDGYSDLSVTVDTGNQSKISFYSKISSEEGYDSLAFYIDGVLQDYWSGESGWQLQTFTFLPGIHTFTWSYIKDSEYSDGSDCGWIDDVEVWGVPQVGLAEDCESGDLSSNDWCVSGASDWSVKSNESFEGSNSIKSGGITDYELSELSITVDTAGNNEISFYSKVSSEEDCDYLTFYIDGVEQDYWSGEIDWELQVFTFTPGVHTFTWSYTKDESDLSGSDCAWIDDVQLSGVSQAGLAEGFESGDFDDNSWEMYGNSSWEVDSNVKYEGSYSAKSGGISHDENSDLEITVDTGNFDSISFYSKVSSEMDYDFLEFYIDGVSQDWWSGNVDWGLQSYTFTPGVHTFMWSYYKDESDDDGLDCGWIDDIQLFMQE